MSDADAAAAAGRVFAKLTEEQKAELRKCFQAAVEGTEWASNVEKEASKVIEDRVTKGETLDPNAIAQAVTPFARAHVPDSVRRDILKKIVAVIDEPVSQP